MNLRTRYGQPIMRIIAAYPANSQQLVVALETLVITVMNNTQSESRDQMALAACQQMHTGPPKGIACGSCFQALEESKTQVSDEDQVQVPVTPSEKAELESIERTVRGFVDNSSAPVMEADPSYDETDSGG